MGKAVATTKAPQLPAALAEAFQQDAGQGLEQAGRDDFAIPFLGLLQKMSPQVDKDNEAYLPDAEPGMIYNTVTRELYDGKEGVIVVPCHFEKVFNEFVPRDSGGGWRGSYQSKEEALENVEAGNEIIDTANHYVIYKMPNGGWAPALISCTSTKLKVSRQWNAKMRMVQIPGKDGEKFTPATFAQMWALTSVGQENKHGKFSNFNTELVGLVDDPAVYEAAKQFRTAVTAGKGRIDYDTGEDASDAGPTGESVKEGADF